MPEHETPQRGLTRGSEDGRRPVDGLSDLEAEAAASNGRRFHGSLSGNERLGGSPPD